MTENEDKPSAVQVHAYANFAIRPLRCPHGKSTEHAYELKSLGDGRAQLWTDAKRLLYEKLLAVWDADCCLAVTSLASEPDCPVMSRFTNNNSQLRVRDVATDDNTNAYPTEAKEIAKAKKKNGHIAKKKTTRLEEGFHELGSG